MARKNKRMKLGNSADGTKPSKGRKAKPVKPHLRPDGSWGNRTL